MRGVPSVATAMDDEGETADTALPRLLGQRPSGRFVNPAGERRRTRKAHHRDTPPEDVHAVAAGLLARGSSLSSGLPGTLVSDLGSSDPSTPVVWSGRRLAAYSCGGSSGLALAVKRGRTGFPLSSGRTIRRPTT